MSMLTSLNLHLEEVKFNLSHEKSILAPLFHLRKTLTRLSLFYTGQPQEYSDFLYPVYDLVHLEWLYLVEVCKTSALVGSSSKICVDRFLFLTDGFDSKAATHIPRPDILETQDNQNEILPRLVYFGTNDRATFQPSTRALDSLVVSGRSTLGHDILYNCIRTFHRDVINNNGIHDSFLH